VEAETASRALKRKNRREKKKRENGDSETAREIGGDQQNTGRAEDGPSSPTLRFDSAILYSLFVPSYLKKVITSYKVYTKLPIFIIDQKK
jgi:hypothetical protein